MKNGLPHGHGALITPKWFLNDQVTAVTGLGELVRASLHWGQDSSNDSPLVRRQDRCLSLLEDKCSGYWTQENQLRERDEVILGQIQLEIV